jgi:DNA processing protein
VGYTEEHIKQIALTQIPGIGAQTMKMLLAHFGSASGIFSIPKKQLQTIHGVGTITAQNIHTAKKFAMAKAEEELKRLERFGIEIVFFQDATYPKRLKEIPDAPMVLYKKGAVNLNARRILAVVGSRNATAYGSKVVQEAIGALKNRDVLVVSGLAYGIDVMAHRACLQFDIPTVGVVGHGLHMIYPSLHKATAEQMLERGGLLTEFTTQASFDRNNFPARNRVVAGMSDATLVVEAAIKGGALITAQFANDYNRDVLAVPGRIDDPYSQGCNNLLQKHMAHAYTGPQAMLALLGWDTDEEERPRAVQTQLFVEFTPDEAEIAEVLRGEEKLHVESICIRSGMPVSRVLTLLMGMELKGGVRSLPGKVYALI